MDTHASIGEHGGTASFAHEQLGLQEVSRRLCCLVVALHSLAARRLEGADVRVAWLGHLEIGGAHGSEHIAKEQRGLAAEARTAELRLHRRITRL